MIEAAEPVLLENSRRLKTLLERSNETLSPLSDPLLEDHGVHEWLSRSREEAYSDWLAWVLKQIKEPRDVLRLLDIDDLTVEAALRVFLWSLPERSSPPKDTLAAMGKVTFGWSSPAEYSFRLS